MLSYRHAFHAGNFADVLKHFVLVEALQSLRKKDTPFEYIDTHAGAGRYDLGSAAAAKTAEATDGIGKLQREQWPELAGYFEAIEAAAATRPNSYPGSPLIAAHFLRSQDRGWLYEMHSSDYATLEALFQRKRRIRVEQSDGFRGLLAHLPPTSRRALVLVDPSYELKTDYDQAFKTLEKAQRKFPTGIYALWYPVVERERIDRLQRQFINSGIRRIHCYELGVRPDDNAQGMTASGMLVINPPWGLYDTCQAVLPRLAETLKQQDDPIYRCDILVDE